jgi:hypothetical protein
MEIPARAAMATVSWLAGPRGCWTWVLDMFTCTERVAARAEGRESAKDFCRRAREADVIHNCPSSNFRAVSNRCFIDGLEKVGEAKDATLFHTLKRGDVRHDSAAISHEQGRRPAIDKLNSLQT